MDSINTILNSKKFLKDAPGQLNFLIRRNQRETFKPEASPNPTMLQTNSTERNAEQSNPNQKEDKKKNVA